MITSALISQLRRDYGDQPKSSRAAKEGNGSINTFNVGKFPILESSYTVRKDGVALIEGATSGFTIDADNGDILIDVTPASGEKISVDFKYVEWRDQNWLEAINDAISELNARGFFKEVNRASIYLSANVNVIPGPTNAVDAYELLYTPSTGASPSKLPINWSYRQDANNIILGAQLTSALSGKVSYLRNLQQYSTTSATIDANDEWIPIIKKRAGASFYRSVAGRVAKQGAATIEEGHLSFSNLRTMAEDLERDFDSLAQRKKPTRPAKDIQYMIPGGGVA